MKRKVHRVIRKSQQRIRNVNFFDRFLGKKIERTHLGIPTLPSKVNSLEIGNRRAFSCRILSRKKRSTRTSTATTATPSSKFFPIASILLHILVDFLDNTYLTVDFVGYIKHYSLANDDPTDMQYRAECRPTHSNILTPSDVWNAIGPNPTSCLLTMGKLAKRLEKSGQSSDNSTSIDRMFLYKLNVDGQFTYFDHM